MDYQDRITNGRKLPYTINTEMRMLYNPQLKGAYSFVPGVMAMVLIIINSLRFIRIHLKGQQEQNLRLFSNRKSDKHVTT